MRRIDTEFILTETHILFCISLLLFCYVGSNSSMHNSSTAASQGALFFFIKVTLLTVSQNDFFTFFELVSTESCFTDNFPFVRIGKIKQTDSSIFPVPRTLFTYCFYLVVLPRSSTNAGISEINRLVHVHADSQQIYGFNEGRLNTKRAMNLSWQLRIYFEK